MEIIINEKWKEKIEKWKYFSKNPDINKKLTLRMEQLNAIPNLYELWLLPQLRMHKLSGDREYEIAIDITKTSGYRIVFKCLNGAEDLISDFLNIEKRKTVTKIEITQIWNYH